MIGSAIFRALSNKSNLDVYGSIRSEELKRFFKNDQQKSLIVCNDLLDQIQLANLFSEAQPNIVINCVGLTKHHKEADDALLAASINTMFPHRLADLCKSSNSRLIHISTDCIFSGLRGSYLEGDHSDADDIYGKSKYLGEVTNYSHVVTLRTSTIGHELQSAFGLLDWFLGQKSSCQGFKKAFFSGVPTVELAKIIEQYVLPNPQLCGLYHVGANKISKYDLLTQIAHEYNKKIEIIPNVTFKIDRSLNSDRFYEATGYKAPSWAQLIKEMHLSK